MLWLFIFIHYIKCKENGHIAQDIFYHLGHVLKYTNIGIRQTSESYGQCTVKSLNIKQWSFLNVQTMLSFQKCVAGS